MSIHRDLYRVRSLGEHLQEATIDPSVAGLDTPILLHAITQAEYWAKYSVRTMALASQGPMGATGIATFSGAPGSSEHWESPALLVLVVSPRPGSVDHERISVGRSARADTCMPYPRISKHHAEFRLVDGEYELIDAGSTNGTYVNGERLAPQSPQRLPADCILHFGKYETRFMMPANFRQHVLAILGI